MPIGERTGRRGRPDKLDSHAREIIVQSFRVGLSRTLSAKRAGITHATLCSWLAQGRADREAGRTPWPYDPATKQWAPAGRGFSRTLDLLEACERAEADLAAEQLLLVRNAAKGGETITEEVTEKNGRVIRRTRHRPPDWRAAAWLLERAQRSVYGDGRAPPGGMGEDDAAARAQALAALPVASQAEAHLATLHANAMRSGNSEDAERALAGLAHASLVQERMGRTAGPASSTPIQVIYHVDSASVTGTGEGGGPQWIGGHAPGPPASVTAPADDVAKP